MIRHVVRGLGPLPHFGHHPGWVPLILIVLGNLLVGAMSPTPINGWLMGGVCCLLIPIFLYGAYDRSINDPE